MCNTERRIAQAPPQSSDSITTALRICKEYVPLQTQDFGITPPSSPIEEDSPYSSPEISEEALEPQPFMDCYEMCGQGIQSCRRSEGLTPTLPGAARYKILNAARLDYHVAKLIALGGEAGEYIDCDNCVGQNRRANRMKAQRDVKDAFEADPWESGLMLCR